MLEVSPTVVWQIVTTIVIMPLAYFLKASLERLRQIEVSLAATREQLAEKYATKADVHTDVGRVLDRLDRLDHKLDKLLLNRTPHGHTQ